MYSLIPSSATFLASTTEYAGGFLDTWFPSITGLFIGILVGTLVVGLIINRLFQKDVS